MPGRHRIAYFQLVQLRRVEPWASLRPPIVTGSARIGAVRCHLWRSRCEAGVMNSPHPPGHHTDNSVLADTSVNLRCSVVMVQGVDVLSGPLPSPWVLQPVFPNCPPLSELAVDRVLVPSAPTGAVNWLLAGRRAVRIGTVPAWNIGSVAADPVGYTSFGFTNPMRKVLANVLMIRGQVADRARNQQTAAEPAGPPTIAAPRREPAGRPAAVVRCTESTWVELPRAIPARIVVVAVAAYRPAFQAAAIWPVRPVPDLHDDRSWRGADRRDRIELTCSDQRAAPPVRSERHDPMATAMPIVGVSR